MPLDTVRFNQFRNIVDDEIPVASRQVFFIGENGQGKTNFLEAVYCLCYGKSFRTSSDQELARHGADSFGIAGVFGVGANGESGCTVKVTVRNGKKDISLDGKTVPDRASLVSRFPCVVFCHDDLEFVRGAPENQRLFFDQTASLLTADYLGTLRDYLKILKTRNALLKDQRVDLLPVYDEQLIRFGLDLRERRSQVCDLFNQRFGSLFREVSESAADVAIRYRSNWDGLDETAIRQRLSDRLPADLAMKTSTSGVHRDRYQFMCDGRDFTLSASTGQFRLMSLLLRLCQATLLSTVAGRMPILLLDDVLLELDPVKRRRFLAAMPSYDQAFFTFLPDERVGDYVRDGSSTAYWTEGGTFREKSL